MQNCSRHFSHSALPIHWLHWWTAKIWFGAHKNFSISENSDAHIEELLRWCFSSQTACYRVEFYIQFSLLACVRPRMSNRRILIDSLVFSTSLLLLMMMLLNIVVDIVAGELNWKYNAAKKTRNGGSSEKRKLLKIIFIQYLFFAFYSFRAKAVLYFLDKLFCETFPLRFTSVRWPIANELIKERKTAGTQLWKILCSKKATNWVRLRCYAFYATTFFVFWMCIRIRFAYNRTNESRRPTLFVIIHFNCPNEKSFKLRQKESFYGY